MRKYLTRWWLLEISVNKSCCWSYTQIACKTKCRHQKRTVRVKSVDLKLHHVTSINWWHSFSRHRMIIFMNIYHLVSPFASVIKQQLPSIESLLCGDLRRVIQSNCYEQVEQSSPAEKRWKETIDLRLTLKDPSRVRCFSTCFLFSFSYSLFASI